MKFFQILFTALLISLAGIFAGKAAPDATTEATNADQSVPPPPVPSETAREFYNAGTAKLRAGKWGDAETLLESSLAKQDERVQPAALFNLGHVRFAQGIEELKKSPAGAANQGRAVTAAGTGAVQQAVEALAGDDVSRMVEAYLAGRGVRKEMREATKVVQRAMEAHGKTLTKWRRSLSDFKSAAELNPADTNAAYNAEVVERAIAKLVDSLREMQQAAANLGGKQAELNGLLKQLKGKIPAPNMPPGAAGDKDDEDGDDGQKPSPESLTGQEESDKSGGGQEMDLRISVEQAGQLMNSIQPDGKQLPMGQGELGQPKNRSGRIW
jgi:transposase-like protein